jgi:hypothetical protein
MPKVPAVTIYLMPYIPYLWYYIEGIVVGLIVLIITGSSRT